MRALGGAARLPIGLSCSVLNVSQNTLISFHDARNTGVKLEFLWVTILRQYILQIALVILAFGFVFSILGVYGSHQLPFYIRFIFWTVTMATGILATIAIMPVLVKRMMREQHPVAHVAVAALLSSIPVTLVITFFNPTFNFNSSFKVWGLQFGYVLIVSLIVGGIGYPFLKKIGAYGDIEASVDTDVDVFLKRLPLKFQSAELYGFSAEDHYLRVYTSKGEALILLRFADAMRDVSNAEGLQVHRSWWIMKSGVVDTRIEAGKRLLILKSETKVPVSRTYLKNAKQAFSF